ncbi:MAG: dipeptide epimerase, partial [Alphaproteobacteria bacterium]|nr:dipeptide epimerase [Alphaproteobacteria bacterium]
RREGKRGWELAGLPAPKPCITAETLPIGSPDDRGAAAAALRHAPLLKVKLGTDAVVTSMAPVRENAPTSRIIIDPNESWTIDLLAQVADPLHLLGIEMIEQPLKAGEDDALVDFNSPIPICADEACHTVDGLAALKAKYQMINVKLDKTGGLTEAIHLTRAAKELGFSVMIGCMVGTSLAMAPATLLGAYADFVDLDGPLLMKKDRDHGLDFTDGLINAPGAALWG